MSYTLMIKTRFDAAHLLPGYIGKCALLHGHSWDVNVRYKYKKVNDLGMCDDFKVLKEQVTQVINNYDHRYLNDLIKNPTAENLAETIYGILKRKNKAVSSVEVWETPTSMVEYAG